jgi:hypothetical protein
MSYILTEKLTSTVVMYMILKRLLRKWTDWPAFSQGIIDKNGKRIRKMKSAKDRESFDILDRFCWSIKRLNTKYLGDTKFSYIFSAAYLMKDSVESIFKCTPDKYLVEIQNLTATNQMKLYKVLYELEQSVVLKESHQSHLDFESKMIKINTTVNEVITRHGIELMVEDGEGAGSGCASVGDAAQFTPMLRMKPVRRSIITRRSKILKHYRSKRNGTNN